MYDLELWFGFVAYGVYGLGLWFMVYGLWFMVYGLWFMVWVCGLWLTNPNCLWFGFVAYGLWCGLGFSQGFQFWVSSFQGPSTGLPPGGMSV